MRLKSATAAYKHCSRGKLPEEYLAPAMFLAVADRQPPGYHGRSAPHRSPVHPKRSQSQSLRPHGMSGATQPRALRHTAVLNQRAGPSLRRPPIPIATTPSFFISRAAANTCAAGSAPNCRIASKIHATFIRLNCFRLLLHRSKNRFQVLLFPKNHSRRKGNLRIGHMLRCQILQQAPRRQSIGRGESSLRVTQTYAFRKPAKSAYSRVRSNLV